MTPLILTLLILFLGWALWGFWREPFGAAPLTECGHCGGVGECGKGCCNVGVFYGHRQEADGKWMLIEPGPCRECQKERP